MNTATFEQIINFYNFKENKGLYIFLMNTQESVRGMRDQLAATLKMSSKSVKVVTPSEIDDILISSNEDDVLIIDFSEPISGEEAECSMMQNGLYTIRLLKKRAQTGSPIFMVGQQSGTGISRNKIPETAFFLSKILAVADPVGNFELIRKSHDYETYLQTNRHETSPSHTDSNKGT